MVGAVFFASGWSHLKDPAARGKSIGMSKGFTVFLGLVELAGSLGVMFGVLTQLAALGLIVVMLGAIQKKIFVWHTGFWGEKTYGWHYDLMLVVMSLVILFTNAAGCCCINGCEARLRHGSRIRASARREEVRHARQTAFGICHLCLANRSPAGRLCKRAGSSFQ
jgi:putative oxidoreductase